MGKCSEEIYFRGSERGQAFCGIYASEKTNILKVLRRINHLQKSDMVPGSPRTPDVQQVETAAETGGEYLPAFLADGGDDGETGADLRKPQPYADGAE